MADKRVDRPSLPPAALPPRQPAQAPETPPPPPPPPPQPAEAAAKPADAATLKSQGNADAVKELLRSTNPGTAKPDLMAAMKDFKQRREEPAAAAPKFVNTTLRPNSPPAQREALTSEMGRRYDAGAAQMATLNAGDGSPDRQVAVRKVDDNTVTVREFDKNDPVTMPRAEFERQLTAVSMDGTKAPEAPKNDPHGLVVVDREGGLRSNGDYPNLARQAQEDMSRMDKAADEHLEGLSEKDRAAFKELRDSVSDPLARYALNQWAKDGKLAKEPLNRPDADGKSLVQNLAEMAGTKMQGELKADKLVAQTIRELDDPAGIDQGPFGTCAATTAQIALAKKDPAEYARLMTGLAKEGSGEVKMRNGDTLSRVKGTEAPQAREDGTEDDRSDTSRLFQSAAMDYANGTRFDYVPKKNASVDSEGKEDSYGGLNDREVAKLSQALEKREQEIVSTGDHRQDVGQLMSKIEAATKAGEPIKAGLFWEQGFHEVLVTGMDAKNVTISNPQTGTITMDRRAFEKRLDSAIFPKVSP